jgi:nucleotide-binding universal stress UspA family protein
MYKHILLPTDGSPLARAAALAGVKLARKLGARITGFYAAPPATPIEYKGLLPVGFVDPSEHEKLIERAATQYLQVIEKTARAAGVVCNVEHVVDDFPDVAIISAAKRHKCDLILMPTHGRRGIIRASMLGTITQKVLQGSNIPVLVHR